jgi:hypothetical protein
LRATHHERVLALLIRTRESKGTQAAHEFAPANRA